MLIPTAEGAVLTFFRRSKGLIEKDFGRLHGLPVGTITAWETGKRPLPRQQLVELLAPLGVDAEAVDLALRAHERGTAPQPAVPGGGRHGALDRTLASAARSGADLLLRELTRAIRLREAAQHRRWAEEVWQRMPELSVPELADVADRAILDERSWALAERLCKASVDAAAHRAADSLQWAGLAIRIAEGCPPALVSRERLLGWCKPFEGNSWRVGGNLPAAGAAFARGDELWEKGKAGDPFGLLDSLRRLDLKASFLRQTGDFDEALHLLNRVLAASPPEAVFRLLINKATTLSRAGDYKGAIAVLHDAEPRIDARRDPREPILHAFALANNFCHADCYEDAERLLGRVELLAAGSRRELDRFRTLWLRGRICLGLGRRGEALSALSRVREHFEREKIAYDFALVSLEQATIHLEQRQIRIVRDLAERLFWVFQSQQVHAEALAALNLFCQAVKVGEADASWTRRLVKYLYRAQYNPKLCFEG